MNMHRDKGLKAGRGGVGKATVGGVKCRNTNEVVAKVMPDTKADPLRGCVEGRTDEVARVCPDEGRGYAGMGKMNESVKHSAGENVCEQALTNGLGHSAK